LQFHLLHKCSFVIEGGDTVRKSVSGNLHATGGDQFFETFYDFRTILFKQIEGSAGDAETERYFFSILFNNIHQHLICGQVTSFCQTVNEVVVLIDIEIIMFLIDVEEAVRSKEVRLIYLKVEANGMHG
jgi:hypothetical protein